MSLISKMRECRVAAAINGENSSGSGNAATDPPDSSPANPLDLRMEVWPEELACLGVPSETVTLSARHHGETLWWDGLEMVCPLEPIRPPGNSPPGNSPPGSSRSVPLASNPEPLCGSLASADDEPALRDPICLECGSTVFWTAKHDPERLGHCCHCQPVPNPLLLAGVWKSIFTPERPRYALLEPGSDHYEQLLRRWDIFGAWREKCRESAAREAEQKKLQENLSIQQETF